MDGFIERDFLGTSRGLSDFLRFKEVLNQIQRDEGILRELISRFLKNPSNKLLREISERSSHLKADLEGLKKIMNYNDIDGAIFYCVEVEGRVAELLERAKDILQIY